MATDTILGFRDRERGDKHARQKMASRIASMSTMACTQLCRGLAGLALVFCLGLQTLNADAIIFKDGFVVNGKVDKETDRIVDKPSGQTILAPKGHFHVRDGYRKISFGHTQVQDVFHRDFEPNDSVKLTMGSSRYANNPPYHYVGIPKVSDMDKRWQRTISLRAAVNGQLTTIDGVKQRLGMLTPQYARIDALTYSWSAFYNTNELGIDEVRELLENHPELQLKKDKGDVERRFKIARFLKQAGQATPYPAGWYLQAEQELDKLLKDVPAEKQRVTEMREQIKGLKLQQAVEDLEHAEKAHRHGWLQKQLAAFPKEDLDESVQTRLRALGKRYEVINDALKEARKHLKELPDQLQEGPMKAVLQEAAAAILQELNEDNVGRLEAFCSFARQKKGGGDKDATPEQVLSLAASGWLLGKESADTKVDVARRLWNARSMVLKLLNTHDRNSRDEQLIYYQSKKEEAVAFDELAQLVKFLPPPEPEKVTGSNPLDMSATSFAGKKNGIRYLLQTPPEYHHARPYPVLIALHQVGEGPKEMIVRCSNLAARHGYLLVAPAWTSSGQMQYFYTPEEHAAVLNVLLDLRRRFQVDSDRIFLLGAGEGGAMAYDVGLSHPDLFAGVIPVSAYPQMFSLRYGRDSGNAQHLPFYVVHGTMAGKQLVDQTKSIFDKWIPQQFPALHIEYTGRGLEWFGVELPAMFDWMNRKKRASGYPSLGREFTTMRETDNSFYWLTADKLRPGSANDARDWKSQLIGATMTGRIAEGNQVLVEARKLLRVTVWFARDSVDFTKPVSIRVNDSQPVAKKLVPSAAVLLEELYQRGDRQRLFLAKETRELK